MEFYFLATLMWYFTINSGMGCYPYIAYGISRGLLEVKNKCESNGLHVDYVLMRCYDQMKIILVLDVSYANVYNISKKWHNALFLSKCPFKACFFMVIILGIFFCAIHTLHVLVQVQVPTSKCDLYKLKLGLRFLQDLCYVLMDSRTRTLMVHFFHEIYMLVCFLLQRVLFLHQF